MTSQTAIPSLTLHDGHEIPQLGYGVWQVPDEDTAGCVRMAIEAGYRSIDTAMIYENERGTGEGIRTSGVDRDELFITTKLWNTSHQFDDAIAAFELSMDLLGLDVLDLYLMHWPSPQVGEFVEAWRAMRHLRDSGRTRSIGVCNFAIEHLDRLAATSGELPAINQVELHPYFPQRELRAWCAQHGIHVEAWSPLGQGGELLHDHTIVEIARAHGRTPAQIVLRWHIQEGLVVIPKSVTPSRIVENADIFDFELTDDDVARIAGLDRGPEGRIGPDPSTATF